MADEATATLGIPLDRDLFMRTLLLHLAGTLQEVVGVEEAAGFISVVGQQMGDSLNELYHPTPPSTRPTAAQLAAVLVDLKQRIEGDFFLIEQDEQRIVLGNRACPFGEQVLGRPVLCMMTSNVFGVIAAENLGYARVDLHETIARGAPGCRVVVHLRPDAAPSDAWSQRDYYSVGERPTDEH